MADILIRMEMPKTCSQCPAFNCDYMLCNILSIYHHDYYDSRIDGCPLVELPEHGDLIDRDVFIDLLPCGDIEHDEKIWRTWAIADAIFLAQKTPVVIPSNKVKTE